MLFSSTLPFHRCILPLVVSQCCAHTTASLPSTTYNNKKAHSTPWMCLAGRETERREKKIVLRLLLGGLCPTKAGCHFSSPWLLPRSHNAVTASLSVTKGGGRREGGIRILCKTTLRHFQERQANTRAPHWSEAKQKPVHRLPVHGR